MNARRITASLLVVLLLTQCSIGRSSTLDALGALEQNLARLESLHQTGITAAEVPVLREIFETQFQTLLRLEGSKARGKESTK